MSGRWRTGARAVTTAVLCGTALTGGVAAHGGETTGLHDAPLALGLFGFGVVLVGVSLYADARRDLDRQYVDAGVVVGFLAVVLGIPAYWL
ncbi:hypothetical protein [Haloarchaeobius iranensis]|uniref:Uncharacterized protein n=1 Tax=Haloarchaeobius iranensis TaxID=996166 RepID=A0A1H0AGQ4_9EURY|nr:hypothetical protein [Haloarchaeobius iranensis]SDN32564.1 hypothetical protein SAMN05192554_12710 [Haloarchaeobius iranensis]